MATLTKNGHRYELQTFGRLPITEIGFTPSEIKHLPV